MQTKSHIQKLIPLVLKRYSAEDISAPEIGRVLKLPLHTIYRILKKHSVARRSAATQNKIRFERSPLTFSFMEPKKPEENSLLISGLMLYLGEGAKTGNTVDFTNSDPRLLSIFLNFLRTIFKVNEAKLRFYLYCFSDQNENKLKIFWRDRLKVDLNQFTKPYIRSNTGAKTRTMPYGVLHIRYHDKRLLEKILTLCSDLIARLTKEPNVGR